MPKKELHAKTLVSALVITVIIFVSGVFVGTMLSQKKVVMIESDLEKVNSELESFQLETLMLKTLGENATCSLLKTRIVDINKQSAELGNNLELYREGKKEYDESYAELQARYSRLLVTYWLMAKEMKQTCKSDFITTLYFFSSECRDCDTQSFVLTYFKKKLEDNILIFALNADVSEPSMKIIMGYYNITRYPSMVVEEELINGLRDKSNFEYILCRYRRDFDFC
ncbi:MAG: hypothetical protein V1900_02315 [Candidatus Aenigmatarchaeota archaeon]